MAVCIIIRWTRKSKSSQFRCEGYFLLLSLLEEKRIEEQRREGRTEEKREQKGKEGKRIEAHCSRVFSCIRFFLHFTLRTFSLRRKLSLRFCYLSNPMRRSNRLRVLLALAPLSAKRISSKSGNLLDLHLQSERRIIRMMIPTVDSLTLSFLKKKKKKEMKRNETKRNRLCELCMCLVIFFLLYIKK